MDRPSAARPPRRRAATYGPVMVEALRAIWRPAIRGRCGSRRCSPVGCPGPSPAPLAPPWKRSCSPSALADRPPAGAPPAAVTKRLYGRPKPGPLAQASHPGKDDRWDVTTAGVTEIDLVAICGSFGDGEFVHSLTSPTSHTTWVETAAVLGKSKRPCRRRIESSAPASLPLPHRLGQRLGVH